MTEGPPSTRTDKTETTRTRPARPPMSRMQAGCLGIVFGPLLVLAIVAVLIRLDRIDVTDMAMRLAGDTLIAPRDLISRTLTYDSVQLFDTDADAELERVLFYRFNPAPDSPVFGATVLDFNACVPRRIDSYDLVRIEQSDLTAPTRRLTSQDIPDVGDAGELLLWGTAKNKIDTELIIFAWRAVAAPCAPASPGYINLGTFRGSGGIEIEGNRIRVKDRMFERSHLAVTRVYEPVDGHYRQFIGGPMREPVASAVEFTFPPEAGKPEIHYPERSVLKFYLSVGLDTEAAKKLLDLQVVSQYIDGFYGKDVAEPGQLTSMAEVLEIRYSQDTEKEQRHEQVSVEVKVVNRRPDGSTDGPNRYRVWLTGYANENALPYKCEWRIVGFESLD